MHDTLFANQHGENEGAFSKSRVQEMAELIGLDTTQFNSCLDDGTHESEIAAMTTEAGQLGVNSTPSLFLNGVRIDFTGKYEDLKAEIDAALAG
jgi:protein-disulfide isomerase